MITFVAITSWVIVNDEEAYPEIGLSFDGSWMDVTEQQEIVPAPNILVVQGVVTEEVFQQILDHPDYGIGCVLYDTPNPLPGNEVPPQAEHGKKRSYCAKKKMDQATFYSLFGSNSNRKTRREGANNLISWCKTLPKASK